MLRGAAGRGRAAALGLCASLAVGAVAWTGEAGATPPANSPAYANGHLYRHGVVPPRGQEKKLASGSYGSGPLIYGGGVSGVGVTTQAPKVYLVFWGSQWGTQGTNSSGNITLSGDPSGMAPYVEAFMKGVGTSGETWSGVMTQYCQGIASGSTTCPAGAAHVGYPSTGAFAGVWADESTAAPSQATGHQLGQEAVSAAAHFGNTNQSTNLPAQYVIISPSGTHPDGFNTPQGQFCAWHDYTGDSTLSGGAVSSPYGYLAFTNLPYITDMRASCGQNFVNAGSAGTLDGVSIVEGHEYAETVTDTYPAGGWTDVQGYENGDKCAWINPGTAGGAQNLSLTTGSFAVQATWANDGDSGNGACETSHPIVGGGGTGNTVSVTNPGNQTSTVGNAVSLQMQGTDSGGATLSYSATGLPAGLSISSGGLISGTPTTATTSSVVVTATDGTGASGTTSFTWTVNPASGGGGCTVAQLMVNPGFESGSSGWSATSGVIAQNGPYEPAHTGTWDAWMDGYGRSHTDTLSQKVTIPAGCTSYTFGFWLHIDTAETTTTTAYDNLKVQILSSSGSVLATVATFSNLNHASGYVQHAYNLAAYAGQTVTLKFTGTENGSRQTSFVIDDTSLNIS